MEKSGEQFWFLVRDAAVKNPDDKSQALHLWLEPEDGVIPANKQGFPYGVPLRPVADRLAQLGRHNGKGKKYHLYQLQEMIDEAFVGAFEAVQGITLTEEQRHAVKAAFIDGRRQKRSFTKDEDEQWLERCSWRSLKRPIKKRRPWGQ